MGTRVLAGETALAAVSVARVRRRANRALQPPLGCTAIGPGPVLLRWKVGRSERACTCSACSNAAGAAAGSARTHGCEWAVLRVVDCSSEITVQSVIDIAGRIPDEALTPFLEVRPLAPLPDGRARQPIVRGKRGAHETDESVHFRLASAASRSMSAERLRCA